MGGGRFCIIQSFRLGEGFVFWRGVYQLEQSLTVHLAPVDAHVSIYSNPHCFPNCSRPILRSCVFFSLVLFLITETLPRGSQIPGFLTDPSPLLTPFYLHTCPVDPSFWGGKCWWMGWELCRWSIPTSFKTSGGFISDGSQFYSSSASCANRETVLKVFLRPGCFLISQFFTCILSEDPLEWESWSLSSIDHTHFFSAADVLLQGTHTDPN